jgi:NAD-dependent deacetylase
MIFILTGAGISRESGLSTFRDSDGLWTKYKIEDVATHQALERDRPKVWAFYQYRRNNLLSNNVKPNAAHLALARLEKCYHGEIVLVTQNVDNLHEMAGNLSPIHMHGELLKLRCSVCGTVINWTEAITIDEKCLACGEKNVLRPHIVLFGEIPLFLDEIMALLNKCSLFVSIGTSGAVQPASNFALAAKNNGAKIIELNLEPSNNAEIFDQGRYGPATEVVPGWVDEILANEEKSMVTG